MSHPPMHALLLAAGFGTRLRPLTEYWPKCLMPIAGKPLLQHWLMALHSVGIQNVLVNLHYRADDVDNFLQRGCFADWVTSVYEAELAGTAGTLRANASFFTNSTALIIHADNWCQFDLAELIHHHRFNRPNDCPVTMMTFETNTPQTCGIVELDAEHRVIGFHEKVPDPPGNTANAAIYLCEPEVLQYIKEHPEINDISTQLLPLFIGRISTWHCDAELTDIGSVAAIKKVSQQAFATEGIVAIEPKGLDVNDDWQKEFNEHPIHRLIQEA